MRDDFVRCCAGFWVVALLAGCDAGGTSDDAAPPDAAPSDAGPPDAAPADVYRGCNVVAEPCALPFPSSVFERADPSTPTGRRVDLADVDFANVWTQLRGDVHDGFSPVGPIVTRLPGALRATLPIDYAASLAADAPVLLFAVDAATTRVPFHAVAVESGADRLLVLTPLLPLRPSSRYAVAVTDRLLDPSARTAGMEALLADAGDALWHHYAALRAALPALGLEPAEVVQLWDFHTRSSAGATRDFDAMAAHTLGWLRDHPPRPVVTADGMAGTRLRFSVEIDVPIWREDRKSRLNRDAAGIPRPLRTDRLRGILLLPRGANEAAPASPLLFGHGLAANADLMARLLEDVELERGPFAALLFDWDLHGTRGRGTEDIADIAGALDTPAFATAMLQSAADSLVFSAVAADLGPIPGHGRVVRAERPVYLGQSLGGLIGLIGAAHDRQISAAALNVTGGGLATVLRSGRVLDVLRLRVRIGRALREAPLVGLPDPLALEVVLAMSQLGLDAGNPLNFTPRADLPLLLQESIGDGIMPNLATETLARALGLPLITPSLTEVPGLIAISSPTPGLGLTQFRVSADSFQAHLALQSEPVQRQAMTWLAGGEIVYDCPEQSCDLVP